MPDDEQPTHPIVVPRESPSSSWTRVATQVRDAANSESDQGRKVMMLKMADIFEQEGNKP